MLKYFASVSFYMIFSVSASQATVIYGPTSSSWQNANGLDLRWGKTEANHLQTFDESQSVHIYDRQLRVDYLLGSNISTGDRFRGGSHPSSNPYLTAGNYNAHLLHFDPLGTSGGDLSKVSITFEEDIVAIILSKNLLKSSDSLLGVTDTKYQRSSASGLERHDFLTFENPRTLLVDRLWVGKYWVDDARIITQSVPEPGSLALFGLGLIGLIGARKLSSRHEK